jgi:hypothetical protein
MKQPVSTDPMGLENSEISEITVKINDLRRLPLLPFSPNSRPRPYARQRKARPSRRSPQLSAFSPQPFPLPPLPAAKCQRTGARAPQNATLPRQYGNASRNRPMFSIRCETVFFQLNDHACFRDKAELTFRTPRRCAFHDSVRHADRFWSACATAPLFHSRQAF